MVRGKNRQQKVINRTQCTIHWSADWELSLDPFERLDFRTLLKGKKLLLLRIMGQKLSAVMRQKEIGVARAIIDNAQGLMHLQY